MLYLTDVTLGSMNFKMRNKQRLGSKSLLALLTNIRIRPLMNRHVLFVLFLTRKPFAAEVTAEQFILVIMNLEMLAQFLRS